MDRQVMLALIKDVLAETVRADGPDLNIRQAAILLRVCLDPGPHTVRGLAEALSLGKPAVSRALDALEGQELVRRVPDEADRRSVLVEPCAQGLAALENLADRVIACQHQAATAPTALASLQRPPHTPASKTSPHAA